MKIDVAKIKQDFPCLQNSELTYLDSASTTQRPLQVVERIKRFYCEQNANVHRAIYDLGAEATVAYEGVRKKVKEFINAPTVLNSERMPKNIIFTSGTTAAINLVAQCWGGSQLKPDDEIILTIMEHHSNIVPWQLIAAKTGAKLKFVTVDSNGALDLDHYRSLLSDKTKLVSCTHVSNVLGTVNPIKEIVQEAKAVGAITLVDGAQSVPHMPVNVTDLGCDFYAFSSHKLGGPTGVGVLYANPDIMQELPPYMGGGDMIEFVTTEGASWAELPSKFEAGTPNIAGVVGLGEAIDYLTSIGMENIHNYEQKLTEYTLEKLQEIPSIKIYGNAEKRAGVISFALEEVHAHDIAHFLSQKSVCTRAGHHCAQPLMNHFGVDSTTRISFYIYNDTSDIDRFIEALNEVRLFFT